MDNSGKLVWFFAGAALGATVALLYAPQSGEDTRRYLNKKARKGRAAIADVSRDALDKGRELYEQGDCCAQRRSREKPNQFAGVIHAYS